MQALDGTIPDRATAALQAGCDIVLNCWAKMDDQREIVERFPDLPEVTRARLERVHAAMGVMPDGVDTDELLAKRDALLAIARACRVTEGLLFTELPQPGGGGLGRHCCRRQRQ